MAAILQNLTYQGIPIWRHDQIIQWTAQIVSGFLVVFLVAWFFFNIVNAIDEREIPYGFSFLERLTRPRSGSISYPTRLRTRSCTPLAWPR